MIFVEPQAHIVAETSVNIPPMVGKLLGIRDLAEYNDSESLVMFAGKLCYLAFDAETTVNKNISKVRNDKKEYLANLIRQGHGSVFEHASVSVLFTDVSRIFTHELVRHRPGTAYSQTSGRYVRTDYLSMTLIPTGIEGEQDAKLQQAVIGAATQIEHLYQEAMKVVDWDKMSFAEKKAATSYLRRILPNGQTTNILVTANHRMWRHIFANRGTPHAEIEINNMMGELAETFQKKWPSIYQDMRIEWKGELYDIWFEKEV